MQAGPECHARVERDDDLALGRDVLAPGRADDDPSPDAQDREVLLPGARPVLLVDERDLELADRPQPERLEVPEPRPGVLDRRLGGATVLRREVGAHRRGPRRIDVVPRALHRRV